jgi:hypothetical protein
MDERETKAITAQMSFSNALCRLKAGRKVKRVGWEDTDTLRLRPEEEGRAAAIVDGNEGTWIMYIRIPDLLAEDWIEVDPPELRA